MVINLNFSELIDVAYLFTNRDKMNYSHDIYIIPEEGDDLVNYFIINKVTCENKINLKEYGLSKEFVLEGIYIKQLNLKKDLTIQLTDFLINLDYNDSDKEDLLREIYKELMPIHNELRKIFYLTPVDEKKESIDKNIYSFERRYIFFDDGKRKILVEDIGFFNINRILKKYKEVVSDGW